MVHRKGELTGAQMDREWPHQIALPVEAVLGKNKTIIDRFCRGLSVCPRRHSYWQHDKEFLVYCSAEHLGCNVPARLSELLLNGSLDGALQVYDLTPLSALKHP
jgi:hypothetical protein